MVTASWIGNIVDGSFCGGRRLRGPVGNRFGIQKSFRASSAENVACIAVRKSRRHSPPDRKSRWSSLFGKKLSVIPEIITSVSQQLQLDQEEGRGSARGWGLGTPSPCAGQLGRKSCDVKGTFVLESNFKNFEFR